ncbi:MAG TPA: ASCH domain-containing protein [Planctomycetes bacterium]|nr:ASCH domain-containing protein [Planctomycetota bacterium]
MSEYPEKTCTIDRLVTHARLVEAALAGRKTQQRRNGVYGYPGEEFQLEDKTFRIVGLRHESLGDMTDDDARAEGYPSRDVYLELIQKMHGGMDIDLNGKVWVHEFEPVS